MADERIPEGSTPSESQAATTSLGDLRAELSRDISTLIRQEVELAKAELRESAKRAGKGAGLFSGAGVAGFLALLFLSIALWWGLGYLMGNAWSAVIFASTTFPDASVTGTTRGLLISRVVGRLAAFTRATTSSRSLGSNLIPYWSTSSLIPA